MNILFEIFSLLIVLNCVRNKESIELIIVFSQKSKDLTVLHYIVGISMNHFQS